MNKEELEKLSTEELKALLKKHEGIVAKNKAFQMGIKVTLNSCFGFLGNEYGRFYNIDMAESITLSGQLAIQWIKRKVNELLSEKLNMPNHDFIVAGDTDSIYLTLSPLVDKVAKGKSKVEVVKFLDRVCEELIQPHITASYEELKEQQNAYLQKMVMSREVIADRGIWRKKKNYILNVWNSEGVQYKEPKQKIMGIESVRSSTPEPCRKAIEGAIKIIMNGSEQDTQKYIADFKKEFMKMPIHEIASPRGVSDIDKWNSGTTAFKSGTPIHVKGALTFNRIIGEQKLERDYEYIKNGDKLKFIYLKKANPTMNSNAIAFHNILPKEFGLDKYVDRELQFDKTFLAPIITILDLIGWTHKKINTLF